MKQKVLSYSFLTFTNLKSFWKSNMENKRHLCAYPCRAVIQKIWRKQPLSKEGVRPCFYNMLHRQRLMNLVLLFHILYSLLQVSSPLLYFLPALFPVKEQYLARRLIIKEFLFRCCFFQWKTSKETPSFEHSGYLNKSFRVDRDWLLPTAFQSVKSFSIP